MHNISTRVKVEEAGRSKLPCHTKEGKPVPRVFVLDPPQPKTRDEMNKKLWRDRVRAVQFVRHAAARGHPGDGEADGDRPACTVPGRFEEVRV